MWITTLLSIGILFSFNGDDSDQIWRVVNDSVMGGVSTSSVNYEDGNLIFTGNVSLDNNGGFASIRTLPVQMNLEDYTHVSLRVKGDGNKYSFRLWTSSRWDGASYVINFDTKENEWIEVDLPIGDFYPQFRGYQLRDYPRLDPSKIRQLGILISDKQEGEFKIEVDWIKASILAG
ncbi:MAG: CIA30 family protein [Saprospiraceae bacterium]|nr:CIA30 family protein [Saprospiraceae bacterium]